MKSSIKIGERFDKITVLKILGYHIEPSGRKRRKVLIRCDCGREYEVLWAYVKRGSSKQCIRCGHASTRIVKKGDKFDKLTAIKYVTIKGRSKVLCKCDCGGTKIIRPEVLMNNMTNNCGCAPRGRWKGYGGLSSSIFCRIKRNARVRNIKFLLTIKQLWELYEKHNNKCVLSGLTIELNRHADKKSTASIDRINSSLGYVEGNVQWVHKDINKMKKEMKHYA